ncbi:hypothetical protein FB451DRAFT_1552884 [Mycena latifolia]|nr:hypothetical protein FB451DRAFT_1552884 [Mycena latifolia]
MWLGAVLPVLPVRKEFLTVTRTSAPSPLLLQKSLVPNTPLRARTLRPVKAYLLSALSILALHAALDPALPVFIRSRKHPWTSHPALVLLALSQAALAALYVLCSPSKFAESPSASNARSMHTRLASNARQVPGSGAVRKSADKSPRDALAALASIGLLHRARAHVAGLEGDVSRKLGTEL